MSTVSPPESFCSSCERRCGAEIEACAAAGHGCAFSPISPPTVRATLPARRQLPGIVSWLLSVGMMFIALPLLAFAIIAAIPYSPWIFLLPAVGLVGITIWYFRWNRQTLHALGDTRSGAFLTVTSWPHARRPSVYLWHAPAEPVALDIPPLLVPESASTVAPTALLRDYHRPERATGEEAVKIGQLLLLDLVARGELFVHQRQAFYARGPAMLTTLVTIYELTRPPNPTGVSLSELDACLLRPFALEPVDASLSAEALIGGLYEQKESNPAAHLAERAGRPRGHYSAETLQFMRTTLNQRLAAVAAQHPQLLTTWAVEIGRAIAAHQEASDGGGGGDGGGG